MRRLQDKTNVDGPSPSFPFGRIRDNPGDNTGTPVNEELYGDMHQFFEYLMIAGGVTPNGYPEGATHGVQTIEALEKYIRSRTASETSQGVLEVATNTETLAGVANDKIITPAKLDYWWDALFNQPWVLRDNTGDVSVSGGTGINVTQSKIKYQVIGKTMRLNFEIKVSNSTAPTSFTVLIPDGKSCNLGFDFNQVVYCADGGAQKLGRAVIANSDPTHFQISLASGQSFTNTQQSVLSGSLTFEIS